MFITSSVSAMVQDNFLLVTDSRKKAIFQIDLIAGSAWKIPLPRVNNPIAVVFDPVESKIYWTDVTDKVIKRSNLDGTQEKVVKALQDRKYLTEIYLIDVTNKNAPIYYATLGYLRMATPIMSMVFVQAQSQTAWPSTTHLASCTTRTQAWTSLL